eukprot:CAMPEP_0115051372 /NCGR_PEP_ID=MMETSP0227-20121206/2307_1 /TAXON_ID=89957 /ORGANISM="Polarella glacialis, Strain CCMP 1383" /LENGTH=246 /DNA_ID=CAMNT_0002435339 /DNA_START=174 /DNA_END=915 /DNA_ORIENTATION=+
MAMLTFAAIASPASAWSTAVTPSSSSVSPASGCNARAAAVAGMYREEGCVEDISPVASTQRRRPRESQEPESEPEVFFGTSDAERECLLAPLVKRLRLSEAGAPGCLDDMGDMAVDCYSSAKVRFDTTTTAAAYNRLFPTFANILPDDMVGFDSFGDGSLDAATASATLMMAGTRRARRASPSPSPSPMEDRCQGGPGGRGPGGDQLSQAAWRAEIQRRALDEMRKYRQAVRSCEGGVNVRPCPGF